jgi:hypothetical protein
MSGNLRTQTTNAVKHANQYIVPISTLFYNLPLGQEKGHNLMHFQTSFAE